MRLRPLPQNRCIGLPISKVTSWRRCTVPSDYRCGTSRFWRFTYPAARPKRCLLSHTRKRLFHAPRLPVRWILKRDSLSTASAVCWACRSRRVPLWMSCHRTRKLLACLNRPWRVLVAIFRVWKISAAAYLLTVHSPPKWRVFACSVLSRRLLV